MPEAGGRIGARLREERLRLQLSQEKAATAAGVSRRTYLEWEKGTAAPTATALGLLAAAEFDVLFIVTGRRAQTAGVYESAVETRIAELEAIVAAGEALSSEQAAELSGFATTAGLADRTRAYADRILRITGDKAAERRQREREKKREAAMRRARIRVGDICARVGWSPPALTLATLERLAIDTDVADDLLESLATEMCRLAEDGGS